MLGSSCDSRVRIDSRSKLENQKPYLIDAQAGRSNPLIPYHISDQIAHLDER
jgi:hypothetical protein